MHALLPCPPDPALFAAVLLCLAAALLNGATDAVNAVACAVGSGALSFRPAVLLAAAGNLLGACWACRFAPAVAGAVSALSAGGRAGLYAALGSVLCWAGIAWRFGLPTSESHALLAALAGVSLTAGGPIAAEPWLRVASGLVLSLLFGFLAGRGFRQLLRAAPADAVFFRRAQIAGVGLAAILHGAQDSQKFLGVLLSGALFTGAPGANGDFFLRAAALCAVCMALGTAWGGRRIVDTVGRDMVSLTLRDGFAAGLACALVLLACTLRGLPVSTTHAQTAAILGAGCVRGRRGRRVGRAAALAWGLTFPCCALLGAALRALFSALGL